MAVWTGRALRTECSCCSGTGVITCLGLGHETFLLVTRSSLLGFCSRAPGRHYCSEMLYILLQNTSCSHVFSSRKGLERSN